MFHDLLEFNEEVLDAINDKNPIVALESTIISHGMPYPDNLTTAIEVENIIRRQGAIPATIAMHQGKIRIGLTQEVMEHLALQKEVIKASRRDISFVLSRKVTASTTVAATMFCAHMARLPLFVTGGIGGVHQDVTMSFDISADLIELSNTPVTVVCSGAKSILDLPKTLEVLETFGVPVIGYATDEFPAFYSRSSGIPVPQRLNSVEEVANLMSIQQKLNMKNGIVVANLIPVSAELSDEEISPYIKQAHEEAKHMSGKSLTPFLLKRIAELTAGKSLEANIELIKNNAFLGAEIAIAYQKKLFSKKT
ncbi:pseudouridine-5'-phosphate glycosidase [Legionella pneumophila serogroup 1]|uniref:pseudouridine-5'-phosphate glycosidase n=1 Tax=Legionella pneumophila TaxID=446 RepID=UPI000D7CF4C3|nr:pseudouridine-5'-phosphate glycosidase [Legionella pneumophila]MDF1929442.1 pseudouridine-5'-phosphate glycosidase [Legionella pneumophila]PYB45713.1 pseudouridine-5-phosphate glycosidase [Legionella pneumophila]PYB53167.1 pseudouridine-5-phosphate glycosidase [Legionella pneumophila]PYB64725.1 pseudouridine-5-phosphate glycosidase [Legionella pneumophila]TID57677.1 pseudouridine-5-phosphate glycosidase [Legionella pneumophila]